MKTIIYLILLTTPPKSTVMVIQGDSVMIYTDKYRWYKAEPLKDGEYILRSKDSNGVIKYGNLSAIAYIDQKQYNYKRKDL